MSQSESNGVSIPPRDAALLRAVSEMMDRKLTANREATGTVADVQVPAPITRFQIPAPVIRQQVIPAPVVNQIDMNPVAVVLATLVEVIKQFSETAAEQSELLRQLVQQLAEAPPPQVHVTVSPTPIEIGQPSIQIESPKIELPKAYKPKNMSIEHADGTTSKIVIE